MRGAVIMDITALAVLVGFLICGARRGLFNSLAGLVIVVAALVGAGWVAANFTAPAVKYVEPYLEKIVEKRVDAALGKSDASSSAAASSSSSSSSSVQMPEAGTGTAGGAGTSALSVETVLKRLKLNGDPSGSLAQTAQEKVRETGVSVASAVAQSLAETVLHLLIFLLTFAVLTLLLRAVAHALGLLLKLPGLHFLNHFGGAVIGLAEGALVLFLAIWVLRRFGVALDTDTVSETYLFQFFTTHTPLDVVSFL